MIRITAVSETSSFPEDEEKARKIHSAILAWGSKNIRKFPWRNTDDPYRVIVAEIMLHRTKAEQVERIYEDFLKKYRSGHDFRSCYDSTLDRTRICNLLLRKQTLYPIELQAQLQPTS